MISISSQVAESHFRRRRLPAPPGTCTETFCEECRALCRVEVMANHCGEEHSPQFGLNRIKKAHVSFRSFVMSSIRFCPALSICDFLALLYFALFSLPLQVAARSAAKSRLRPVGKNSEVGYCHVGVPCSRHA